MKKLLLLAIMTLMMILSGCAANIEQEPQTPTNKLINAAKAGDKSMVEELLKEGVDVNFKDSYGYTPIYYAASNGKKDVVEILIAHGANNGYEDPLYGALKGGYKDIAILLIKNGANPTQILHLAAVYGRADIVEFLIDHGADINGDHALERAIWAGNQNVFDVLIAHGADMNVKSKNNNWTLLHEAATGGRTSMVKTLIEKGADVNAKDNAGDTPLHLAKAHNHGETADILIANGADVNIRNNKGETPEIYAKKEQAEDKAFHEAVQAKKYAKENEAKHCLSNYNGREYTTYITNNCNQAVGIEVTGENLFGQYKNTYFLPPGQSQDIFSNSSDYVTKAWFVK